MSSTRLNKFLAFELGISRREADDLIAKKSVRIGETLAELGSRVEDDQEIFVEGKLVKRRDSYTYLAFHKPVGYVCSRKQQGDAETIYALLPEKYHELKPVGRLDKDSSGILLLTNDGDLAHQMTHPSFHKQKTYEICLDKPLEPLHQQMISDYGVQLDDGPSKLILERLNDSDRLRWRVLMHEGRNRQIRRTFAALGYTVTELHRTIFGPYRSDNLAPGEFELVTPS
jgi:23S rRNA pseudouridine2605 synthase